MPGIREKYVSKIIVFSLYDLYGHALAQEPLTRGHQIYNFDTTLPWSSLIHTQFVRYMPMIKVHPFYTVYLPLGRGRGFMICTVSYLLIL